MSTPDPQANREPKRSHRSSSSSRSSRGSSGSGRHSSRSSRKGSRRPWVRYGLILAGLGVFCGGILVVLKRSRSAPPVASATEGPGLPPAARGSEPPVPPEEPAAAVWQGPRPIEVAAAFTAATTHAERLQWVCKPDAVAGILEEFFTRGPGHTEAVTDLVPLSIPANEGRAQARFKVTMADGSFRRLEVPYELDGRAKVDFKSYSRYCSTPWDALLDGSCATAPEMRVKLKLNAYYNRDFSDEKTWLSLIATSPDLEEPLYLYARLDNPELREFLRNVPRRETGYTISIQNTPDGWRHRQFILSQVLRSGWLGE